MIINNIRLKNFRSFEDDIEFTFTPNGEKNIVLIGGENGAGKSTLFEAMKLCIYGPTTYGYQGHNSNYLAKIKNNINNNSFKNEVVDSFINVVISLKEGVDLTQYSLTRKWSIIDKKLSEEFIVSKNGILLNTEEVAYFENYFKSILPPSLFDFFFFDGEELSDFFIGKNASANLKDAILQLFNYDTFNILKKHLLTYQRVNSNVSDDISTLQNQYDSQVEIVKTITNTLEELHAKLAEKNNALETLYIEKKDIENNFRNSGGILEDEKNRILSSINKLENERTDINQYIKDFCNEILPFLLITPLLSKTKVQIDQEDKLSSYKSLKENLNGEIIKSALLSEEIAVDSNANFTSLATRIVNNIFNGVNPSEIKDILKVSDDQKTNILSIVNSIVPKESSLKSDIITKFTRVQNITAEIKELREKLNSSVTGDILTNYLSETTRVNEYIVRTEHDIEILNSNIEDENSKLSSAEYSLVRIKNQYTASLQSNSILDLSNDLVEMLNALVEELSKDKIHDIEDNFIDIFKTIIRKDNYINDISIDDNFNYTLYIDKDYSSIELINLLNNVNFDELDKKYGSKFVNDLFTHYNVSSKRELLDKFNTSPSFETVTLKTKVDVNGFSKGEKQIYILCLIWALIKSSGIDIPFIIDTPYARIDETHRKTLTNLYLPNVSNQVIILSTNEEIDSNLYEVVKPYLCNEYLLLYNDFERKTEVKKGYFKV